MKLDPSFLKHLSKDEFRVLTAVELGQKNHEIVPVPLVTTLANLRSGGVSKFLSNLLRVKLLHHETKYFEGYRLTNLGYDYLALKSLLSRKSISGIGRQIGVGKESDIYIVENEVLELGEDENVLEENYLEDVEKVELCLKIHRLGRTSFRNIKNKRDYHKSRHSPSWLYLSRLAAQKEYRFMQVLYSRGYPVPKPIDQSRHTILMSLVDGTTFNHLRQLKDVEKLYLKLMDLVTRFAHDGLIHGDFNEFNIMIGKDEEVTVIDFPQMVSIDHVNAKMYFERDVNCIRRFFRKRFDYISEVMPTFESVLQGRKGFIDVEVEASGFLRRNVKGVEVEELTSNVSQLKVQDESPSSDGPEEYKKEIGLESEVTRAKEVLKAKIKEKQRTDDLRKTVRREMKRSGKKKGTKKALKVSRNQVKMKNRKNSRAMAFQ